MGGNAFKAYPITRIGLETYRKLCSAVHRVLPVEDFPWVAIPLEYTDKTEFGDVDVLYQGDNLAEVLGDRPTVVNGDITSSLFLHSSGLAQVDFQKVESEWADFAFCYYSHGVTGALLGKLARSIGLKLCREGLYCQTKYGAILVTRNWEAALSIMGYEPAEQHMSKLQTYQWLTSSTYFDHLVYMGGDKHPDIASFGTYVCKGHFPLIDSEVKQEHKRQVLVKCMLMPAYRSRLENAAEQYQLRLIASRKLNGHMVARLTYRHGKSLGELMTALRQPGWEAKVAAMSSSEVVNYILNMDYQLKSG